MITRKRLGPSSVKGAVFHVILVVMYMLVNYVRKIKKKIEKIKWFRQITLDKRYLLIKKTNLLTCW